MDAPPFKPHRKFWFRLTFFACAAGDRTIHFDVSTTACANQAGTQAGNWHWQSICKRTPEEDRPYVSHLAKAKCDPGFEIETEEECITAGSLITGVDIPDGTSISVGPSLNTPCGCFVGHIDRQLRFDGSGSLCDATAGFDVVCRPDANYKKYKTVEFATECSPA